MEKYDVIIAGASTTGSWFARQMAQRGHSVLVLEKELAENVSRDYDIFHMGQSEMQRFDLIFQRQVTRSLALFSPPAGISHPMVTILSMPRKLL